MNDEVESILIGQAEDIEPNNAEHFEHEEIDYAIYHLDSGFYATQGMCTCKDNALLSEGTIENEEIECFSCGKSFSIVSGDCVSNPEIQGLKVYDVATDGNDLYLNI